MAIESTDFVVETLGINHFESPLRLSKIFGDGLVNYETDARKVLFENIFTSVDEINYSLSFEIAGPREKLFFNPSESICAIVSCGGLCPGINNVIKSLVMHLTYGYGVKNIFGVKYGLQGFIKKYNHPLLTLNPEMVKDIYNQGGSILGTSRGNQDIKEIVNYLEELNISCLFTIGGDGTLRAANEIFREIKKRDKKISIVSIPKTIDNDIMYIEKSFGFETAFSEASKAIGCAHVEAVNSPNGIGIVKLMGRHSGYVAACAALSLTEVNLILVPEQPFKLLNVCKIIQDRLQKRGHIVIVVAEGAGQDLITTLGTEKDSSGNTKLKDIGQYLVENIREYFKNTNFDINIKYIDPSYIIRSIPANPADLVFTGSLGQYAADAALAGKTGIAIGYWKDSFTHLPTTLAISQRNVINLESELWGSVLKSTGQSSNLS